VRVTPTQIKKMLEFLPLLQRTMVILCSLTAIRISECVGLRWSSISWLENKIYIWQRWRRGKIGKPKTLASDSYVALTPVLARHLELWRKETPYAEDTDWVFASEKTHGKTPRFGGMLVVRSVAAGKTMAGCGLRLKLSLNSSSRKCHPRRRVWGIDTVARKPECDACYTAFLNWVLR
jgi:integrase